MSVLIANNAVTILASGINNSQTSVLLNAGTGALFPNPSGGDVFFITISSASNPSQFEIMRVTARSTDTLTVVRAQDGTTAKAFAASDIVASLNNAQVFTWLRQFTTAPTSTGSANAQAAANSVPFVSVGLGAIQVIKPGFTNTGSMTLNADGIGAVTATAFGQNLQAGMVVAGVLAVFRHDSTNWELVNPQTVFAQLPQATGTGNAQVVGNTANPIKSLIAGIRAKFLPVAANTAAATLNQDGTGATAVKAWGQALIGGEMGATTPVEAMYDGAAWELVNPFITALGLANGALEATVFTGNGTFTPKASANYLVIAIGGGGGGGGGGGTNTANGGQGGTGGSGGQLGFSVVSLTAGTGYAVVIGALGAHGNAGTINNGGAAGSNGGNTTFNGVTIGAGGAAGNGGRAVSQVIGASSPGTNGCGSGGGQGGAGIGVSNNTGNPGTNAAANTGSGGGGGGGGSTNGISQAGGAGGDGATGILIVIRA